MEKQPFNRRKFISDTLKVAIIGSILPVAESCNNKKKTDGNGNGNAGGNKYPRKPLAHHHRPRKKWSHEGLVMNTKTKVMHLPSSKVYHYYDEIIPKHFMAISLASWATQWQEPVRVNRDQSGNILEMLALNTLSGGISAESLEVATDTLSRAFSPACADAKGVNLNMHSFRLHELMLQLIALNTSIPAESKWTSFNSKVTKPQQLRKRQKWMENEPNFNERIKYILDRKNEYMTRLSARASRFTFT
ncbi:MAG TPA: hypothetical protein VLJ68_13905 [Chitinophagaceae bacterium]|nr:hypothetical protein [Chitinophagaceae bacterium]